MKAVTYDLRARNENSDYFYEVLASFSRDVYDEIREKLEPVLIEYGHFLEEEVGEASRSEQEYAVEFLTLAMTWRRYLGASQHAHFSILALLKALYKARGTGKTVKRAVDPVRGILNGLFMVPWIGRSPEQGKISIKDLHRLVSWLEASGEFKDEVRRFRNWVAFFDKKAGPYFSSSMMKALAVFDWFQERAKDVLGEFTGGVGKFLDNEYRKYRWREDEIFCGKDEVEYHINMVASHIINLGFQEEFLATPKRAVLVPGCMRINGGRNCRVIVNGDDIICSGCSEDCGVNKVTGLGRKVGFETFIVPHSSSFTRWLKRWENTREYGVVAVACLLNIAVGGYEMRGLNIPSQCVLLDFCGCRKHWHEEGIVTDLNLARLERVVLNRI